MDRWKEISKYVALCVGVAVLIVFFAWAERGMKQHQAQKTGPVEFESIPTWVTDELRMDLVALVGGAEFELHEDVAQQLGQNLERSPWLEQVRVQLLSDSLLVVAHWRKPVAQIEGRNVRYYVDAQAVALQPLVLPTLPIVTLKGVQGVTDVAWGTTVQAEDVLAGLALIKVISDMDQIMAKEAREAHETPKSPLLFEFLALDLRNYNGRVDQNKPHLTLESKDGTSVVWGAELGAWGRQLEAPDDVKLARLFGYFHHDRALMTGPPPPVLPLHLPQGQTTHQPIHRF